MSSKFFLLQSILLSFCISLIVITSSATHMLGNDTDRVALLAFKSQVSLDSPWVLSSWNSSSHFCTWVGVTCGHRHGRVIQLNLYSHGLAGSISPYIGNLSFLRNLDLSNNMLNGQIPQEIGRLYKLQNLSLIDNSLSGPLPVNLSRCLNLKILRIVGNNLTGRIPEAYGSFPKLNEFTVQDNSFTGGIPTSLGNLSSMNYLQLNNNQLTGSIPDSLCQLTKLWFIGAGINMLSGMVPPSLFNISSLKIISLTDNHLEGNPLDDLGLKLPNLKTFFISGNQLSGPIPASLFTNTSKLQYLGLQSNNFSGAIPVEIGKQWNLKWVGLSDNSLGSGGEVDDLYFLISLNNCTNLQQLLVGSNNLGGMLPLSISNLSNTIYNLGLGNNKIFGSIPLDIGNLYNLQDLSFRSNKLTGGIPTSIGMLPNLTRLDLSHNTLSGHMPNSIGNLSSLVYLYLSHNFLEGNIIASSKSCRLQELLLDHNRFARIDPKPVFEACRQLVVIDISNNYFVHSLPVEVGNLINLWNFDLSENKFVGSIPSTLGSCSALEELYLQGNFFCGHMIPPSFKNLINMEHMDLSRNNLSGQIFKDLENLRYLQTLNLSFNYFEGEVPVEAIFRNTSAFSIVGNDNVCGGVKELHLHSCPFQKQKKKRMPLTAKLTLGIILPSSFMIALLLIVLYSRKQSIPKPITRESRDKLPRMSYKDLYDATNGFSPEALIGTGSYGSVFKGVSHKYESVIAVKVLNLMARGAFKNFVAECEVLRNARHRNLLKILTVCSSVDYEGNVFKALVFEFMSNGSLESWLHPTSNGQFPSRNLDFLQRLNITINIAFALDYLHNHFGTPIVHCDLKPSNVLLNQEMIACLGDFGLAKFLIKNIYSSDAIEESISNSLRGTIGYIPPEYGMGLDVSREGDVYSYGILMLEMFTGKRPTDPIFNNNITLHSFCESNLSEQVMDILDSRMLVEETPEDSLMGDIKEQRVSNEMLDCLISIMKIGVVCSSEVIVDRMSIKDVATELQVIKENFMKNRE